MPGPQPCRCRPFIFRIVGSGLDRSAGRRGRRPLQWRSVNLPPPYTPAAARGLAALRPPVTVIRKGKVHPSRAACTAATPSGPGRPGPQPCRCRPFIFRIVGSGLDRSAGRRGRRRQPRGRIGNPPLRTNKNRCPCAFHRQRLSIFQSSFQSRLIHTAGTSSSVPRPCWRPRLSCSQSQTRSLQCSRQSPSSRRDPCRGS